MNKSSKRVKDLRSIPLSRVKRKKKWNWEEDKRSGNIACTKQPMFASTSIWNIESYMPKSLAFYSNDFSLSLSISRNSMIFSTDHFDFLSLFLFPSYSFSVSPMLRIASPRTHFFSLTPTLFVFVCRANFYVSGICDAKQCLGIHVRLLIWIQEEILEHWNMFEMCAVSYEFYVFFSFFIVYWMI